MNTLDAPQFDRLLELFADRATQGLSESEARELDRLVAESATTDTESMDRAAAAADLAFTGWRVEPMPAALRASIESDALARLGAGLTTAAAAMAAPPARSLTLRRGENGVSGGRKQRRSPLVPYAGWLAAAAAFALAAAGWWPGVGREADPGAARQRLLAGGAVVQAAWIQPADGVQTQGDVVWDDRTQTGYMRFISCLPVNDPRSEQYQLWIFDADRDDRFPVDGGVFDIARQGETVVPIRAKLPVSRPTMFAITVENPGGVVVSDRSRLPLLAKAK